MNLGEQIRSRRKEMRLSIRKLGERAEVSASYLCDLEHGKRGIGAETLLRISRVIGVPLDQLMNGSAADAPCYMESLLELPASLITFATNADIPFRHAVCMFWCARTIRDHQTNTQKKDVALWDWTKFYDTLKEWL